MKMPEFSKLIIACVGLTYFIAFALGVKILLSGETDKLSTFYIFVGSATSVAIGFYSSKSKSENVAKINRLGDEFDDFTGIHEYQAESFADRPRRDSGI